MTIEFCNESGDVISSYRLINGWVTKIEAPDLNVNANEVATILSVIVIAIK